jgi:hypothetical protein
MQVYQVLLVIEEEVEAQIIIKEDRKLNKKSNLLVILKRWSQ